jgi:hypothetical protein
MNANSSRSTRKSNARAVLNEASSCPLWSAARRRGAPCTGNLDSLPRRPSARTMPTGPTLRRRRRRLLLAATRPAVGKSREAVKRLKGRLRTRRASLCCNEMRSAAPDVRRAARKAVRAGIGGRGDRAASPAVACGGSAGRPARPSSARTPTGAASTGFQRSRRSPATTKPPTRSASVAQQKRKVLKTPASRGLQAILAHESRRLAAPRSRRA